MGRVPEKGSGFRGLALRRGVAGKARFIGLLCADPDESGYCSAMVSFTAATSWLRVNGFGRNANCWFSGRLFSKASSA